MCPAGAQGRVSRRSEPRIRAAAGAAVSARRLIALMVTRVIIRSAVLAGPYDAGTRLIQRYRGRAVLLPESAGLRQGCKRTARQRPCCLRPGVAVLQLLPSGQSRRETERQSAHRLGSALRREPLARGSRRPALHRGVYGSRAALSVQHRLAKTNRPVAVSRLPAGTRSGPRRGPVATRVQGLRWPHPRAPHPLPPS